VINLKIRIYRPGDDIYVIKLWQECGLLVPWNNPLSDIDRKYADPPELFFVGELDDALVATCMVGYDGHRGWLYYLAVKRQYQRQAAASLMINHAETVLVTLGCPKVELMVRESNEEVISFYQSNAYKKESVHVMSKRLIEDEAHDYD
jgi:ribosomal protein S18 acetylase RimI-like enzyme